MADEPICSAAGERDLHLREHVLYLLAGGGAHPGFEDVVAGLPPELRGVTPEGFSHSPWRLLEHLRIAQWDILEFCRSEATPDLLAPVPHGEGQTFLREALLVADHNAWHLGQLVQVRRALGAWPPG